MYIHFKYLSLRQIYKLFMKVTIEIFDKISTPKGRLDAKDLTPEQKKQLYSIMMKYGATEALAYNRFFDKGFDEWELRGINQCKDDFICEYLNHEQDATLRNTLNEIGQGFYSALPLMSGLRAKLLNLMAPLGMVHRATVAKRFDEDDWKPWERIGIRKIIEEICNSDCPCHDYEEP